MKDVGLINADILACFARFAEDPARQFSVKIFDSVRATNDGLGRVHSVELSNR
jgi:hypothetical protein